MSWLHFIIGFFTGGIFGVFAMSLMVAASKSDDLMGDSQYEE